MTPAENKQTVEALAERVRSAMANAVALRSHGYYKAAAAEIDKHEAALRDLVAQADRAAELEARSIRLQLEVVRLREAARPFGEMAQEMLNGHPTGRLPEGAPEALLSVLARPDGAVLAGDGGGADG